MKRIPLLILTSLLLAACGKPEPMSPSDTAVDYDAGKRVATEKCAGCHGLDGKSTGPDIPNLAAQKEPYLLIALNNYRTGARLHAALQELTAGLNPTEVRNVAAYYARQKPVAPAGPPGGGDILAAGKDAATPCFACHGKDGNSTTLGTPSLAGQHPGYLTLAMQGYVSGARAELGMAKHMSDFDSVLMEDMAMFFASQAPTPNTKPAAGSVAAGEPLTGKCGGCHGLRGHSSNAKTPSLAGQDPVYLFKTMKHYRDTGRVHPAMKTMLAGVKDKDLENIAAFYAAQTPERASLGKPTAGQEWAERCDRCHGPGVENPSFVAPYLNGQPVGYMVKALRDYRDGKRMQSAMHAMGAPLTDADIQAIAEHYSGQATR